MNNNEIEKLLKQRAKLLRQLNCLETIIDGSLVIGVKSCGRKNCKCRKGKKHRHVVISRRKHKKTEIVYVSLANEKTATTAVAAYSKCIKIIKNVCDINIQIFKAGLL